MLFKMLKKSHSHLAVNSVPNLISNLLQDFQKVTLFLPKLQKRIGKSIEQIENLNLVVLDDLC